jgi:hypothetical protein
MEGDGFGITSSHNWRGAGRPAAMAPLPVDAAMLARAEKVISVYQFVTKAGFRTFGDFLIEFLSNGSPEIKYKRTRFFNTNGEQVMALMLKDSNGGNRRDTWSSLKNWILDKTDQEVANFINKEDNKELLRHKERLKKGNPGHSQEAVSLVDYQNAIVKGCPLSWDIFCKIGETIKEQEEQDHGTEKNSTVKHIPLNSFLALLYCRNNQVNAYQVSHLDYSDV